MKKFKKELSWLLVVALVVSNLSLGLGQMQTQAAVQATGQTIRYWIEMKTRTQTCVGSGTDSDYKLRIVFDDGQDWYSEVIDDTSSSNDQEAGDLNNMYVTGPAKPIASTGLYQVNSSAGLWQWDYINLYADFGMGGWVRISGIGAGEYDSPGGTISVPYDGVTMDTNYNRTMTFNGNGGTINGASVYELKAIQGATLPSSSFPTIGLRTGWGFTGWSAVLPTVGPSANTTYTAQWSAYTHSVVYNGNGNTGGSTVTSSHTYDTPKALSPNGFIKTGYTFTGWATTPQGTASYFDGQSVVNLSSVNGAATTLYAKWAPSNVNIAFDANGGVGGTTPLSMAVGTALVAPTVTREGYTFIAWSPSVPAVVPSTDRIYTAVWLEDGEVNENAYGITFNANGGSGVMYPQVSTFGQTVPLASVGFARTGYTFLGWATSKAVADANGVEYTDNENYTIGASDVTLYAVWKTNAYLITFSANGGTNGSQSYRAFGESLSSPEVSRMGYAFTGWSPSVPSAVPSANSTYTAQWSANSYTVVYVGNGNTGGATATSSFTYDMEQSLRSNGFIKTGYTFDGWATSSGGTVAYTNGQSVRNLSKNDGATVVLYAKWTIGSYTVTFSANGGTGGTSATKDFGSTLTAPTVTRTGYIFEGWSPAVPATVGAGNATYTAQWTANTYNIVFDANGGTGGSSSTKTYGTTLTAPTVTRTGFTFKSWSPSVPSTVGAVDVTYTAQWTEDTTWTITFSANGGTGGSSKVMASGTTLTAPTVTRAGYTFVSWSPTVPSTSPAADVTYTAQWKQTTYNITFDANGGTGGISTSRVPGEALTAPTVTKTGYTFTGWLPAVPATVPGANTTYVAQWEANSYTITFDDNGGTGGTSDAKPCGAALSAPSVTRTGYTLISWSPSVPTTVPATDTTYTAQWTANTYTVSYSANGGSGSMPNSTHIYNVAKNLTNSTFSRTGYIFMGWNTAGDGSGTTYANGQSVSSLTATNGATVMLYAKWEANQYTVTYDGNGASGFTADSVHMANITKNLTISGFSRMGYIFDGWSLTPGGALYASDGGSVTNVPGYYQGATVRLYARWTPITYIISYSADATSGISGEPMDPSVATYDVPLTLRINTFTRTGYSFVGWAMSSGGDVLFLDEDYVSNWHYENGSIVTLYAVWSPNAYIIHYNDNGATSGITVNSYHYYDHPKNLTQTGFYRTGYTFTGWATSADGPKVYDDGQTVQNLAQSGTFNLYAKWTPITYQIAYNQNGGMGTTMASSPHTYDAYSTLNSNGYTKIGHSFQGWALTDTATTPEWGDQGEVINLTSIFGEVITFYAVWAVNKYTITFDANGGNGGTAQALDYGTALVPPAVTKEGNTFNGWVPPVPATVPASNNTYYAMWSPKSYPVNFDANGGTGGMSGFMVYGSELTPPVVSRQGYIFLGWSPEVPERVSAGAVTYTAQWEAYVVTITFDANGGIGGTSGLMNCDTALGAPAVSRVGYTFDGWSPEVPSTVPTQDTTYTAQWTPIDYTVVFDANGGEGSALPVTQGYETQVTLPTEGFEKTGHTFAGWNTQPDAITVITSYGVPFEGGTLYAIYTLNSYEVAFDVDGGSSIEPISQNFATAISAPADPEKLGYTFDGWAPEVPTVMPATDTLCVAQWNINQYTVTFDKNSGEGLADPLTQDYDTAVALPSTDFIKMGYTHIGWNTDSLATTALAEYSVPAQDATLYAIYAINQYSITFNTDGGPAISAITQDYGTEITVPSDPVREGYTFTGWSPGIPEVMPAGDVECVAQWTINQYTVTFDTANGMALDRITQDYGATIAVPSAPTRPGYVFLSWLPEVPANMPAENITCVAQWELAGPVTLTVNSAVGAADEDVVIAVNISGNSGLAAAELYLAFDNTKLAFVNATNGTATVGGMSDIFVLNPVDATTTIKQNFIHLDGIAVEGCMMQITFKVLPGWMGSTPVELAVGEFFENSLIPLDTIIENGNITSTTSIVTFDSDGGSAVATLTGNEGDILGAPIEPVKVGYTFVGWSPELPAVYPVNGINVVAQWNINQYTVTFDANGGESAAAEVVQDYTTPVSLPIDGFLKSGYTFIGWNTDPNAESVINEYSVPAEDTVLYAVYTINGYTLTFNAAGGTGVNGITQDYGTSITPPADPTLEGYTFSGWLPAVPSVMPSENVECIAQWTANRYTVTFNANGGTGSVEAVTQDYATEVTLPETGVAKTGYTFVGWNTDSEAATAFSSFAMPIDGATLYAVYTINSYAITFDANGGTDGTIASIVFGTALEAPVVTMTGYTFMGWMPEVPATVRAEDAIYTAQWSINSYTVTFDANDGIGGTTSAMDYGAALEAPIVTREGYTFTGWTPVTPVTVQAADATYTAQWSINSYTVTFNAADGVGGTSDTLEYGTALTAPEVTRVGYTFVGWTPEVPATVGASNTTYVALWSINSYTVTFDANEGTGSAAAVTQEYMTEVTLPTGYAKEGNNFLGWNTTPNAASVLGDFKVPAGDATLYAIYGVNQYTVVFDANGGIGGTIGTMNFDENLFAPIVTKVGYTFTGWTPAVPGTVQAWNATYTAQWNINSYAVTFDANGGEGGTSVALEYNATLTAPTVTKTGYTFAGWTPAVPVTVPASDTTYTAQWTINQYSITFDEQGGSAVADITKDYGTAVTAPADPTMEGYTFTGWLPEVPSTMPAENMECIAQWSINSYTVTFDANGGEGGTSGAMVYETTLQAPIVTREGYTFLGWTPAIPLTVQAGETTYTAQWSVNSYTVTFDANGGEGGTATSMDYGTLIEAPEVTRVGYTFVGWTPEVPATVGASNTTYLALWSINSYTIAFDANGGEGSAEAVTKDYATQVTLPATGFAKTGYTFIGWNTDYEAATALGSFTVPVDGATLYAIYIINSYTVTFDANGGEGYAAAVTQEYATAVTLPEVGFAKTGYTFIGWNTDLEAATALSSFTVPVGGTTLYAIYAINSYTVTFDANGGIGGTAASMNFGALLEAPEVTRVGYTFTGWTPVVPGMVQAADAIYTAQWSVNSYTVTFDADGGIGGTTSAVDYGTALEAPIVTREGYTFTGWTPAVPATVSASDTNYVAQWIINQYSITFDSVNGSPVDTITQDYGTTVTSPADPTREGYTFAGWLPEVPSIMPANDTPCVAQWTINEYRITFDSAEGSAVEPIAQDYGSAVTAPADPTREGYTFMGWLPTVPAAMPAENVDCVAQWSINSYTVTFNAADGVGGTSDTLEYGTALTAPEVTRVGYTFMGWTPVVPGMVQAADATYTAQWSINSYTVTFDANEGIGGTTSAMDYGTALEAPIVTREGYTFTGWTPATPVTVQAADATYTAQWSINSYTVTFNAADGVGGTSDTLEYGTALTAPVVTRVGHTFAGWTPAVPEVVPAADATYTAQWSINSYTVTFDANDGIGGTTSAMDYGTTLQAPVVTRVGHTFVGWTPEVPEAVPAADTTYTAQWSVNSYIITFDANGGMGGTSATMEYGTALTAPVVTKAGYTFAGWTPVVPGSVPAATASYVANWSINSYTISFSNNGGTGSASSVQQDYNTTVTLPATGFAKTGYTFMGWNTTAGATSALGSYNVPAGNATLYAVYKVNQYTVSFDANDGTGSYGPVTQNYNTGVTLPLAGFEKTGYIFLGWNTSVGVTTTLSSFTVPASDVTLYAIYIVKKYTVTFDANGGTGGTSTLKQYGSTLTAPLVAKKGCTFTGWAPEVPATVGESNATYVAQWSVNSYTVAFDANGGDGGTSGSMQYNAPLTAPIVTKTGYTLVGWTPSLPETVQAGDATYTAQWEINKYKITFDANGGTGGTEELLPHGEEIIVPTVTKEGHTFIEWTPFIESYVGESALTYTAQWSVNSYTIVFDGNNGEDFTFSSMQYGETLTPPTVVMEGYTFLGWSPAITATVPAANTFYVAQWEINKYDIVFDANDGEGGMNIPLEHGSDLSAPDVTRTGYTFSGWLPEVPETALEDAIYTAQWSVNSYTVTFDADGGEGGTVTSMDFDTVLEAPVVTKEGYTFEGWSPEVPETVQAEDATYIAQWSVNSYTISFDKNGGVGSASPITQNYNTQVTLPAAGFTKAGYTFLGWNTTVGATTALDNYNVPATDVTLYAIYEVNHYTMTFNANGGAGGTILSMTSGSPLVAPVVTRTGYNFTGWTPGVPSNVPAADKTFTAGWVAKTYTVAYNANTGTGSTTSSSHTYDVEKTLTANGFTKAGYYFIGWATTAGGAVAYTNAQSVSNLATEQGTITLYAKWSNSSNITFDANGGTGGLVTSMTYGATLSAPAVTKIGYTFTGWYPVVPETVPAGDATYLAQWSLNSYAITWNANGGSGGGSNSCDHGAIPTALDPGTKSGYTFAGWSPTVDTATGPATYTAQWSTDPVTITFDANGGTGGSNSQMIPEAVLTPPTVTKTGYTFNGWSPTVPAYVPTANTTYTAQWSINPVTITFDANGGTGGTSGPMNPGAALIAPVVAKTGYTFTGWLPTVPVTVPAANITYTAQWVIAPSAPTGLTLQSKTDTTVSLSWSSASGATSYNVYNGAQKVNASPITSTSYTVTGLTQATQYSFTVTALYGATESSGSTPLVVTTQDTLSGTVQFAVNSVKGMPGEEVTLQITISSNSKMRSAGLSIYIDPNYFDTSIYAADYDPEGDEQAYPTTLILGDILNSGLTSIFFRGASDPLSPNTIVFGYAANRDFNAGGTLLTIKLKIRSDCQVGTTCNTSLVITELKDKNSQDVPFTITQGEIIVGLMGDINGDGLITPNDAMLALQAFTGAMTLTSNQILLADVNGDGLITPNDAMLILQYFTGAITEWPS